MKIPKKAFEAARASGRDEWGEGVFLNARITWSAVADRLLTAALPRLPVRTRADDECRRVLASLVELYLANPGDEGEFVACITPPRGSVVHQLWRRAATAVRRERARRTK